MDPKQLISLAWNYALGAWRFRWIALATSWAVGLAGFAAVLSLPNQYEAATRVFVDTQNLLRPLLSGLYVETDVMSDVMVMTRVMVSRPHLEEVMRETDMDLAATTAAEREAILASLERRIKISGNPSSGNRAPRSGENIFTISFTDSERTRALEVVQSLLDTFVERTIGSNIRESATAEATLRGQIEEYESRLQVAEERLKAFKQQNVGLMPGQSGDYYSQRQNVMSEISRLQRELKVAMEKQESLQRQIDGVEPVLSAGGFTSAYDQQIAALQQQKDQLLLEYTDRHPEVVRTQIRIDELTKKREEALAAGDRYVNPENRAELAANPVFQNLQIQLSDLRVDIARINAEIRNKEEERAQLEGLVDVIPEVEAELARLNRDYEVIRDRHQEMIRRWESLQTGKVVSAGPDRVTFRVIEPPHASVKPVGPPRELFMAAVLVVSIGAGVALALLLHLVKPVFMSRESLERFGVNILPSVSYVASPSARTRARIELGAFALTTCLLIGVMASGAMFAHRLAAMVPNL